MKKTLYTTLTTLLVSIGLITYLNNRKVIIEGVHQDQYSAIFLVKSFPAFNTQRIDWWLKKIRFIIKI